MGFKQKCVNVIREIGFHFNRFDEIKKTSTPISLIREQAIRESYEFIQPFIGQAALFNKKPDLQKYALQQGIQNLQKDELLLEFGVFKGTSINRMAAQLSGAGQPHTLHGFDSFVGLEEDWKGQGMVKGFFSLGGELPPVRKNVALYKGWVQDTLPEFLAENKGDIAFMHMDLDTYTPTKLALELTKDRVRSGTVILFDELHGYPGWQQEEFKALNEVYKPSEYEFIGFAPMQAAIVLK